MFLLKSAVSVKILHVLIPNNTSLRSIIAGWYDKILTQGYESRYQTIDTAQHLEQASFTIEAQQYTK